MPPLTREIGEQRRNLWILAWIGMALLLLALLAAVALYLGYELPGAQTREYYTSSTGYAAPPHGVGAPPGSVPRGALSPAGSDKETESLPERVPGSAGRVRNPFAAEAGAVELGRLAYAVNCGMCHGEVGQGVGPVGERYTPRPPDLSEHVPAHPDGYLYAAITGGIRSTPTPEATEYLPQEWHSFRGRMSARERWAVVTYLRSVTGPRESGASGHAAPAHEHEGDGHAHEHGSP